MISQSRVITLITKLNPSVFQLINKDVFGTSVPPLGSTQGAVRNILTNHEEMLKSLMPAIISTNPSDPTWYKKIANYWDSFSLKVPVGGVSLEVGFSFNLNDHIRKSAIKELISEAGLNKVDIKTDENLRDYVTSKIPEFEKYRYATPINVQTYLTWIYCLGHRKVANDPALIDKTTKIAYVLIDPKQVEDSRRAQHSISIEATKKYLELLTDRKKVRDILYIRGENASNLEDIDADAKLKIFVDSNPKDFLAIVNDSAMAIKARIERYCVAGILRRLPSTSIIVDGQDNGVVIGNTLDEAVAYFSSEAVDRVAKVKEFATRYNQNKTKN